MQACHSACHLHAAPSSPNPPHLPLHASPFFDLSGRNHHLLAQDIGHLNHPCPSGLMHVCLSSTSHIHAHTLHLPFHPPHLPGCARLHRRPAQARGVRNRRTAQPPAAEEERRPVGEMGVPVCTDTTAAQARAIHSNRYVFDRGLVNPGVQLWRSSLNLANALGTTSG